MSGHADSLRVDFMMDEDALWLILISDLMDSPPTTLTHVVRYHAALSFSTSLFIHWNESGSIDFLYDYISLDYKRNTLLFQTCTIAIHVVVCTIQLQRLYDIRSIVLMEQLLNGRLKAVNDFNYSCANILNLKINVLL